MLYSHLVSLFGGVRRRASAEEGTTDRLEDEDSPLRLRLRAVSDRDATREDTPQEEYQRTSGAFWSSRAVRFTTNATQAVPVCRSGRSGLAVARLFALKTPGGIPQRSCRRHAPALPNPICLREKRLSRIEEKVSARRAPRGRQRSSFPAAHGAAFLDYFSAGRPA
ncbi:hypothetical protein MRX96_016195 [Rhipicephalus microplus]